MRLGRLAISVAPFDDTLDRLCEQLARHRRHHDLAQNRHEHRDRPQHQHADVQPFIEQGVANSCIDGCRRHGVTEGIVDLLLAILLEQPIPEINVVITVPFERDEQRCEKRLGVGHLANRRRWGQLLDLRAGQSAEAVDHITDQRIMRPQLADECGVGCIFGELAEVIWPISISDKPAEELLVGGGTAVV
ncbi:hypothetical protein D3C73_642940 [compost metagenome]